MSETYSPEDLAMLTEEERNVILEPEDPGAPVEAHETSGTANTSPAAPVTAFRFQPTYEGPPLAELDQMAENLDRQLEEGDIDIIEYTRLRDPIVQQRFEAGMVAKHHEGIWRDEQDLFFRDHPEFRSDPTLNAALQSAFARLDTPENAHRSGVELLDEARKQIEISAARVLRERQSDFSDGRSGGQHGGHGDFSYLDHLEGAELERALAGLSPDQEEAYLRG